MNLTCEVTKEDLDLLCFPGPTVNPYLSQPQEVPGRHCHSHRRSEGGAATGGPRESRSQEVRGRHCHRRSEGDNMVETK